nr:universal stress protein [Mycolicibacterium malmesburyense]
MSSTTIVVLVVVWVLAGLGSGLWMARRGFDPLWILVALPLGPLFVPIAAERVQRRPDLAAVGARGAPPGRVAEVAGPRVLIGLDGSTSSERALSEAVRLFGPWASMLVLAAVVHFEATEEDSRADIDAAAAWLAALAARLDGPGAVHTEVLAGPPGPTLRQFAEQQDMDVVVVGRRGRGLSTYLLGSVSAHLVEHCSVPVLVIGRVEGGNSTAGGDGYGEIPTTSDSGST